jgi:hypothetical protein
MSMDMIRSMVREVLAEELGNLRRTGLFPNEHGTPRRQVREETVSIRSDADLRVFISRLLDIFKDGRSREEIEQGRWIFRLGSPSAAGAFADGAERRGAPVSAAAPASAFARIERGVVSERQIESLPAGTTCLVVGKAARLTPLALDRLRMLGIALRRTEA